MGAINAVRTAASSAMRAVQQIQSDLVYDALGGETEGVDEFELIGKLEKLTKTTCPKALSDTKNKPVRFTGSIKPEEMAEAVLEFINK